MNVSKHEKVAVPFFNLGDDSSCSSSGPNLRVAELAVDKPAVQVKETEHGLHIANFARLQTFKSRISDGSASQSL